MLLFVTQSHCVAQAGLELTMQTRLVWNSPGSASLCLPSVAMKGVGTCVCTHMCRYRYTCVPMCVEVMCHPSDVIYLYFLETISLHWPVPPIRLGWPASEPQGSSCLCLPSVEIMVLMMKLSFLFFVLFFVFNVDTVIQS